MYKKPEKLKKGDRIGIFLPSSPIKNEFREKGINEIREMGYIPVEVEDVFAGNGYSAKEPEETIKDLRSFFSEKDIKALWAARGGYSANHLLRYMNEIGEVSPKILIGSSDVSYLLWYFHDRKDMVVFYGPMAFSSIAKQSYDRKNLNMILSGNYENIEIPGIILKPGSVK
ncbi:MAG: LD-carboxypeptidase, partial [Acidobacteriota bacterium]